MENIDFKDLVKDKYADKITSRDPKLKSGIPISILVPDRDLTIKNLP